jgi:hypothetical protein
MVAVPRWVTSRQTGGDLDKLAKNASRVLIVLVLGAALFWSWGGALSILLGGALAILNFRWMKGGIEQVLGAAEGVGNQPNTRQYLVKYLARLVLIFLGLFAIIKISFLSLWGALLGLSIFVLAGFLEVFLLGRRKR